MPVFEFTTFIDIVANNYEDAIHEFEFKLKYGDIERSNVYIAEIEEK